MKQTDYLRLKIITNPTPVRESGAEPIIKKMAIKFSHISSIIDWGKSKGLYITYLTTFYNQDYILNEKFEDIQALLDVKELGEKKKRTNKTHKEPSVLKGNIQRVSNRKYINSIKEDEEVIF